MIIKKKITFALEYRCKVTKKNGEKEVNTKNLPLRMRVSYNNIRIEFVTGFRLDADKWDAENQRATGMNQAMQTASEINDYLDYLKAEIIKVFHKYEFMEVITTIKTTDSLVIELDKYSKAILEKYKDADFEDFKVLPVVSNQKMNDSLHELCKMAKINEPIRQTYYKGNERIDKVQPKYELVGTHTGRRTFICNALSLNFAVSLRVTLIFPL